MTKKIKGLSPGQIEDKFMSNVVINFLNGCWEWCGPLTVSGYGDLEVGSRKHRNDNPASHFRSPAHRYSYILHYKVNIPENIYVCHHCDNPKCVNPSHLFLGTNSDNQIDCVKKGRDEHRNKVAKEVNSQIAKTRTRNFLGRFI